MAIATSISRHTRAKAFKDSTGTLFIGIGKSTQWNSSDTPPQPSDSATSLSEPIGYKQVDTKEFVIRDSNGTIEYLGEKWKIVSDQEAQTSKSRWIYIKASINYTELPTTTYRQIGIFSGLKRRSGVLASKSALLPSEVESVGSLEVIDNTTPNTRSANQKDHIHYILEF